MVTPTSATVLRTKPIVVLDNSVALAMTMPDEQREPRSVALLEQVENYQFIAPALWRYEFANSLNMGLKRQRITHKDISRIFSELDLLCVYVDEAEQAPMTLLEIADKHGLTGYDAAYLELAIRLNAKLATNDKQLITAAGKAGVALL